MRASDYPDHYSEAFAKALDEPVKLTFSTNAKAVAFRVELYKYRYAVRDELPHSRELYDSLSQIRMSIKDKVLLLERKKRRFMEKLNDTQHES